MIKADVETKKRMVEVLYFIMMDRLHQSQYHLKRNSMTQVIEALAESFGNSPILAHRLYEKMRHPSTTPPLEERISTLITLGYSPRQVGRILNCSHTKVYQINKVLMDQGFLQLTARHNDRERTEMLSFTKTMFFIFGDMAELTGSKEAQAIWK